MNQQTHTTLANSILDGVEKLVLESEADTKPMEVDPYRRRLFELFVAADGGGYVDEEAVVDLTADGLCHELSKRWNLADATRDSIQGQTKMSPENLSRMRLLWSVMRLWMEWAYAWERWEEFHTQSTGAEDK